MALPTFRVVPAPSGPRDLGDCTVVVLGCRPAGGDGGGARLLPGGADLARRLDVDAGGHLARASAKGTAGEVVVIPVLPTGGRALETVLLVGIGDGSRTSLVRAGAAAARAAGSSGPVLVAVRTSHVTGTAKLVEGWGLAAYAPAKRTSAKAADGPGAADAPASKPAARVDVVVADEAGRVAATAAVARTATIVGAVHLARELANVPANLKSPRWLAGEARRRGERAGLDVRVRDERELVAEGFGGLVGVGQGSERPPRFVELAYRPRGSARRPHVVLVGKGIVFDSGGLSIKGAASMDTMKTDMAGASAVLAVMTALADLGVAVRVTGLLAIAENLPGAAALRPDDVITPYGGRRTVEITNTDAEGRLVLADGLAYADLVLRADAVIDIATLTGAASVALGRLDAPLFATDERLATALLRAADAAGERLWRMPLVEDYRPVLESSTADLVNAVLRPGHGGGSIVAALFLREFTGGRPWAHLDIAGTGRADAASYEISKGATGFGVRLLLELLTSRDTLGWRESASPGQR